MSTTSPANISEIRPQLDQLFGDRLSANKTVLETHGRGEGLMACYEPDLVVFPNSTEEVSQLAKLCNRANVPLIPFGAGTSLEGHVSAPQGGISIDFTNMNHVLAVHPEDMDAVVQPGVTRKQLNAYLRDTGQFFPVDPGADATLGGMAGTRASGTSTVRYGSMRDNVLGLEAVLADGRVIRTGTRARKSAAGYDLTHLLIGSEGTLGIITELTVRLHGIPETIIAAVCPFPSVDAATECVITAIQMGVPMARMELMDAGSIEAVNAYSNTDYTVAPTLFLEFEGSRASVQEQVETLKSISEDLGASGFHWAENPEERTKLWTARHNMYYAGLQIMPNAMSLTTDVCVPISQLAACIRQTQETLSQSTVKGLILGHVGDGNFHTLLLFDPADKAAEKEAHRINATIVRHALSLGGTCTGEHGIGMGKTKFLKEELGPEAVDVMADIKRALDPNNILNPGKIIST